MVDYTIEGWFWLFAFCLVLAVLIVWAVRRAGAAGIRHMLGIAVIRDQDDEAIRRAVIAKVKSLSFSGPTIEDDEHLIEETARHAIAEHFASVNPGKKYTVTAHWPIAKCVISGNIAVVRPMLGLDFMGDRDGLRACNVEIKRESEVLELKTWHKQPEDPPIGRPIPERKIANARPSAPPPVAPKPRPIPRTVKRST